LSSTTGVRDQNKNGGESDRYPREGGPLSNACSQRAIHLVDVEGERNLREQGDKGEVNQNAGQEKEMYRNFPPSSKGEDGDRAKNEETKQTEIRL